MKWFQPKQNSSLSEVASESAIKPVHTDGSINKASIRIGYLIYLCGSLSSSALIFLCVFHSHGGAELALVIPMGILTLSCWMYCSSFSRILRKHEVKDCKSMEFVGSWAMFRWRFSLLYMSICWAIMIISVVLALLCPALAMPVLEKAWRYMTDGYGFWALLGLGYLYTEYRTFAHCCISEIEKAQSTERMKNMSAFIQSVLDDPKSLSIDREQTVRDDAKSLIIDREQTVRDCIVNTSTIVEPKRSELT